MAIRYVNRGLMLLSAAAFLTPTLAYSAEGERRRIEEVVVTAERRESTVQDTAISITAFDEQLIEDFGLRNQEDLQNFIPATTIQPYDIAIRGVGRVFRALGGDPGVATYFNGAYSEDFGIASTEGGLYDIARIEVLRGPQGTLYGRNGIGGAVNFHTNKPSDEFSGEVRAVAGSYNTAELYGYLTGPIIEEVLSYRFTGVHRDRDGTVKDLGGGEPLDAYGDENYALALRWTPSDTFEFNIRGNERSYKRVMTSAQGAGSIVISEFGGNGDDITGGARNTSAMVFGFRPVDPQIACPTATDRTVANCTVPGRNVFTFDYKGMVRYGQRVLPGVDPVASAFARPNFAYNHNSTLANSPYIGDGRSLPELDGNDLVVDTNGLNDENFDHQAGYIDATWDVADNLQIKYIGGYTDYLYKRITDDDRSSNTPQAGNFESGDMQFHANQENENFQHEVQFFWDPTDDITVTAGLFYYKNQIDQRLDFWSEGMARFENAAIYPTNIPGLGELNPVPGDPFFAWATARAIFDQDMDNGTNPSVPAAMAQVGWNSARDAGRGNPDVPLAIAAVPDLGFVGAESFNSPNVKEVYFLEGPWLGDTRDHAGGNTPSGPITPGTSFIWNTLNQTEASAVYAQGEWQVNETFALTFGLRWAKDEKYGEENLYLYREEALTSENLFLYNQLTGALDANGNPTGLTPVRFRGLPFSQSIFRSVENEFDEWTWRLNLDYTPADDSLIYLSATTGYRAGGFNLGYFSGTPTYDPEKVLAYELGYKGQLLDGTLQLNGSIYRYDYQDIHLQYTANSFIGPSTSVRNHPGAINQGLELEVLWLATDNITIGGNYSYTDAKYNGELDGGAEGIDLVGGTFAPIPGSVDTNNPLAPASIYNSTERTNLTDGKQLQRVPEQKWSGWAQYRMELSSGTLDFLTSVSWTDELFFDITNSPLDVAPDWYRWDARVTWTASDEKMEASFFINNITNDIGIRNMNGEDEAGNFLRSVVPTLPRMGGVEFRYRFGEY